MIWKYDANGSEKPTDIAARFAATINGDQGTPRAVDHDTFRGAWHVTRFEATFLLVDGIAKYVMRGRSLGDRFAVAIYRLAPAFTNEGATDAERMAVLRMPPQITDVWHQLSYLEGWLRYNRQRDHAAREARVIARIEELLWPR